MKSLYLTLFTYLFSIYALAQKPTNNDSLLGKSYDDLIEKINQLKNDSVKRLVYIDSYIRKAKKENNNEELIIGYRNKLPHYSHNISLKYTDSILQLSINLNDDIIIGMAYIDKATVYFRAKNYEESLKNYLMADKYINEENDPYTQYKIKYGIANLKTYLGNHEEALNLFTECKNYYEKQEGYNNKQGYLHSLCSMGRNNFRLGNYDECTKINQLGLEQSNDKKLKTIHIYFLQSEGINQFGKKNYQKSIEYLKNSLPGVIKNKDFVNVAVNYFYIAKSNFSLGNKEEALSNLQKVDSILVEHHYANLELRETYEIFINYYKEKGDLENQLLYTNRLLDADKILEKNYKELISTIHKEYDTAELVASKNNLEKTLKRNTVISYIIYSLGGIIILIISYLLVANYKKQKRYKQKYEELIAKAEEREKQPEQAIQATKINTDELDINKDIVLKILKGLETFEKKEDYLAIGLTQSALAEELDTNTTYLSKVINHYKGKNFNSYLNELRVNHAVSLLKNSPTHRRYTIKALAEELGFSNPRSFSDAFFSQTGIKPSYFIKQIEKEPDLLMSA